jgi:hypothetical protein
MFYHNLKNKLHDIDLLNDTTFYTLLKNCDIDLCSVCEYFNILPIESDNNSFVVWYSTSNVIDSRSISIDIFENDILVDNNNLDIKNKMIWYKKYNFTSGNIYNIVLYENCKKIKTLTINDEYMNNKIKNNGKIIFK